MKKHYGSIDGLRVIACIGIVMMHIRANCNYNIESIIYNRVIPSFTNFVFLFMTISAFGMFCGYHDEIMSGKISLTRFYGKRFKRILPFFSILVLLDLFIEPSINALYEAFADLTLLFGFLPAAGNISVIGVGWFLGLIFVFYICFPFFCVLIENKRRAWLAFTVSLAYNYVGSIYFNIERNNILYSSCYFLAGGLIYLYCDELEKIDRRIGFGLVVISVFCYFLIGENSVTMLLASSALLIYAIICGTMSQNGPVKENRSYILENKFTRFISSISMEIYLSHMLIFRILQKLGLEKLFGESWFQYMAMVLVVLLGAILLAIATNKIESKIFSCINRMKIYKSRL